MKAIRIEYCTSWGYIDRAVALTKNLLNEHKNLIDEITLIPSSGGVFEVDFEGKNIFSKKYMDRHPEEDEVEDLIRKAMMKWSP